LHRRLVEVGQRGIAVRTLGGDRAGEIRLTRFLRNDKVSVEEIVATAGAATARRAKGLHVLAVQDTTSLRDDGGKRSICAHPTIAVDADSGALLGLVHAEILQRSGGLKGRRRSRGFDSKQSRRWLEAAEAAAGLRASGARQVTVVSDREGDIYMAFARKPEGVELLVRAAHDRALSEGGHLFAHLAGQPEAGRFSVTLAATPGRAAREALLAVRFCPVEIKRPDVRPSPGGLPGSVALHMVEVREIKAPRAAQPVCWRLLTSHPVDSFDQARWIASLYQQRWVIEELFRTLKTRGFDIERVTIAEKPPPKRLPRIRLLGLRTAWRLDRILRKTRSNRRHQRPAPLQSHATGMEHRSKCVNLVGSRPIGIESEEAVPYNLQIHALVSASLITALYLSRRCRPSGADEGFERLQINGKACAPNHHRRSRQSNVGVHRCAFDRRTLRDKGRRIMNEDTEALLIHE
jgi:hypothetical protein